MKKSLHRKIARGTWLLVSTSTKNLLQICIPLKWKLNRQERPLTIVSVIHLELDKEVELFECYECISLHQEVLLISVHRAYLYWTENAKSVEGWSLCQDLSFTKQASPRAQFIFGNYHRLQQLSADDVMFIFCGDVIGTRDQPPKCGKRSRTHCNQGWFGWR